MMVFKALKDIAYITMGQSPESESYNDEEVGMPFFQGNADFGEVYPNTRVWCSSPKKIAEPGDILISVRAPIGALNYAKERCCIGRGLAAISIKEEAERNYVFHLLKAKNKELNAKGTGSTFKAIGKNVLEEIQIPQISAYDKQKCMGIMDSLESIIRKRRVQLSVLDKLIKARFVEMFDHSEFPMLMIEELCSDIVDCPHSTPTYEGELKNPAIRTSEIKKGYILWDSMRYVSDDEYEKRVKRLRPKSGDIVYGREGTFGNAAVLPDGYKFCLGQRVMLLRPDHSKCTSEYLLHAIISDDVYRQAMGKNNASTVAHVNVKDVKQFKVPLPPLEKQKIFASFIKQVDKSKVVVPSKIKNAIFAIMLSVSFGQITSI